MPRIEGKPALFTSCLRSLTDGRLALLLAALLAVLLLAAACDDDDDDDGGGGGGDAVVTVTDLLGRTVDVPANPQAIVGLSPTAVELVYALGGTVIGRSASVDFPPEAEAAADVGTAYAPSIEVILSLEPDLIVADSTIHSQPQIRSALEALDVTVIFVGAASYQDVLDGIRIVGEALGASVRAESLIEEIEAARTAAVAAVAAADVRVVLLIADRDQTLYAANSGGYVGDLLAQIGLVNLVADLPDAGPFPGYSAVAVEKLLELDPDFIFTVTPAPEPVPRLSTLIPQIPPFRGLTAVTTGRIFELDEQVFLQAPGPRVAEAFRTLADIITQNS